MSDELKNAIEEVRNLSADVRDIEDGAPYATKTYVTSILHRTMQAAIRLQSYALATLAAREEKQLPVSEEWFLALTNGFTYWGYPSIRFPGAGALRLERCDDRHDFVLAHGTDTTTLLENPTRGQVLSLLKALGIESEQKHGE